MTATFCQDEHDLKEFAFCITINAKILVYGFPRTNLLRIRRPT